MILVLAELDFDPADAAEGARALLDLAVATRREAGCIAYIPSLDLENPARLRLSEAWTNEAALDAHFQTPHMAAFRARLAKLRHLHTAARKHRAEAGVDLFSPR